MKSEELTFVGREYLLRPGPKGDAVVRVSPTVREFDALEAVALTARKIIRLSPLSYQVLTD